MAKLSSPSEIKRILEQHGFHFSKALGQNFLIDDSVCPRMADRCAAEEVRGVLEIGPGIGVLTKELAIRAEKVCAVELDKRLLPVLAETLAEFDNVKVVQGDVLKLDLRQLIETEFGGGPVSVCANLPYYITSPVIMHLLESKLPIRSITVMVQREAAERICALPGSKACGAVSVGVHYHCRPEILFGVSRGCFMPPPHVDSAVIRMEVLAEPPVSVDDETFFFGMVRAAFSKRRKTAANSISSLLSVSKQQVETALTACGLPADVRAEKLTLSELAELSNRLLAVSREE